MGILDKIRGKAKQAAGDVADDPALRRQGVKENARARPRTNSSAPPKRRGARRRRSQSASAKQADLAPPTARRHELWPAPLSAVTDRGGT